MVAGTLAAGALALSLTGCGESVDPIERLGRKATQEPWVARAPPHPTHS
ncbi:polysaccharide deacetylase family protein, partial [Streptomyces virginiae]